MNPSGWTSTPRVAMYFFSNSPVRCRLTKVVWKGRKRQPCASDDHKEEV